MAAENRVLCEAKVSVTHFICLMSHNQNKWKHGIYIYLVQEFGPVKFIVGGATEHNTKEI